MDFILKVFSHIFLDESTDIACTTKCPYCCLKQSKKVFCEANLNGFIAQPANSFSSLTFCLIALLIIYKFKKLNQKLAILFSTIAFLTGITSFINHATFTYFGQTLDLSSMYFMTALIFYLQLTRLNIFKKNSNILISTLVFILLPLLIMISFPGLSVGSLCFFIELVLITLTELYLIHKNKTKVSEIKDILISLTLMLTAFFIWGLDVSKLWCFENNHTFNGHSVWHVLTAISFYFAAKYFIVRNTISS